MGSLEPQLQSLKVTHVYYNPSDPLSLLSAILALIPQALMVIYVTLIYARREIEVVLMFGGQLLCELSNWVLKRVIKEDRPPGMSHLFLVLLMALVGYVRMEADSG
jgi:dolichyldiphosphatase